MPSALARHLEKLRRLLRIAASRDSEGPASVADAEFTARAYPADTISRRAGRHRPRPPSRRHPNDRSPPARARRAPGSRSARARRSIPFTRAAQLVQLRAQRVRRRRPDHLDRDQRHLRPEPLPGRGSRRPAAASGGPRTPSPPSRKWDYLGGPLGINAAGAVTIDPNDPTGNTIYVGTGEANICGSGCVAGVGLYKSTNGGDTWTGPLGKAELGGKGIGEIVVKPGDPNTIYVGTTTALRGMSSVCCTGVTRPVPGRGEVGPLQVHRRRRDLDVHPQRLGQRGRLHRQPGRVHQRARSARRAACAHVELDPSNPNIVYASSYARGVWRSTDAGATWTQIKPSLNPAVIQTRPAFDVTTLPNGKTRMYVYEGNIGSPYSRLFRSDDVATGAPGVHRPDQRQPGRPGLRHVQPVRPAQCWYDVFVHTPGRPPGHRLRRRLVRLRRDHRQQARRGPVHRRRRQRHRHDLRRHGRSCTRTACTPTSTTWSPTRTTRSSSSRPTTAA